MSVPRLIGLAIAGLVLVVGFWYGMKQSLQINQDLGLPHEIAEVDAMKADLMAIAKAEVEFKKTHVLYAPLEYLVETGAVKNASGHGSYKYVFEMNGEQFQVIARSPKPPRGAPKAMYIDQDLNYRQE